MKTYLDESGHVIDTPGYVPPPDAFVYSTRRGDFVFPNMAKILTVTDKDPGGDGHGQKK